MSTYTDTQKNTLRDIASITDMIKETHARALREVQDFANTNNPYLKINTSTIDAVNKLVSERAGMIRAAFILDIDAADIEQAAGM